MKCPECGEEHYRSDNEYLCKKCSSKFDFKSEILDQGSEVSAKGIFPPGPIGFDVHGIGFEEGNPIIVALIAVQYKNRPFLQGCKLKAIDGTWYMAEHRGNEEEQKMLNQIWDTEKRKIIGSQNG